MQFRHDAAQHRHLNSSGIDVRLWTAYSPFRPTVTLVAVAQLAEQRLPPGRLPARRLPSLGGVGGRRRFAVQNAAHVDIAQDVNRRPAAVQEPVDGQK